MVHFLWASEIQHTLFWIGNFSPRNNKDQIIFNHGGRRISFEEAYSLALLVSYNQIPIQLFSATLAEMRLNRTSMERSIPIQLFSATLAEMRLNRTLMERSIPIPLFSATLAEMRLNRTLMEKYDVNGTLAEMRLNRTLMDCRGLPGRSSSKLNHRTTNQPTARQSTAMKKTSSKKSDKSMSHGRQAPPVISTVWILRRLLRSGGALFKFIRRSIQIESNIHSDSSPGRPEAGRWIGPQQDPAVKLSFWVTRPP